MKQVLIEVNKKKFEVNEKLWNELNILTKEIADEEKYWNPFHKEYKQIKTNLSNQQTLTQIYHVSGVKNDVSGVKNDLKQNFKKTKKKNILKQKNDFDYDEWFIHRKPKIYFENGVRVIDYSPPSLPEKVIKKKYNKTLTQIYSKKIPSNTQLSFFY